MRLYRGLMSFHWYIKVNILKIFRKKPPKKEVKGTSALSWPLEAGSFLEYALGYGGRITPSMAMKFYRSNSTIATAIDKIASRAEQITPVIKRVGSNRIENDHEILDLLNTPNPFDTYKEFFGKLARHYLLTHDSHISMFGNKDRLPLELYAIKPQNVGITEANDGFPGAYNVTVGPGVGSYVRVDKDRKVRYFDGQFKEFYHVMGFSSRQNEICGDSPLEAAALEARQQIKGKYHNLGLLDNGGRLSLIVAFRDSDGIDDDEHKQRKKRINEDLGGSGNAGKIAVISGSEVDIKEVGISNKDMDFVNLENIASKAIYLRYEIPLPLVSTDASTYNNYQTAVLDLYENTVLPLVDTLFSGLTRAIMPRYGMDDLYLSYDPENIKVLMRQMLLELEARRKINIETINELRMLLPSRESVDGGGAIYQPATLVAVGEDVFTEDETDPDELARELVERDSAV